MIRSFSRLGFTMIELLVVIAVIGMLATVVLATLNPVEQLNKSRDLAAQTDSSQLVNGLERYFATREAYPWNETAYCGTSCATQTNNVLNSSPDSEFPGNNTACPSGNKMAASPGIGTCLVTSENLGANKVNDWLMPLTTQLEVKDTFLARIQARGLTPQKMFVYKAAGTGKSVMVCYRPVSLDQKTVAVKTCQAYKSGSAGSQMDTLGLPASACPDSAYDATDLTRDSLAGNRFELICMPVGGVK